MKEVYRYTDFKIVLLDIKVIHLIERTELVGEGGVCNEFV
jgi:hypothetical protein